MSMADDIEDTVYQTPLPKQIWIGSFVKLQIPYHGEKGVMTVAGRVTARKPDGRFEVKTQAHGYHTEHVSKLTLIS